MPFVELHARSAFSFLRGASSPEALMQRAAHLGLGAMAVTDRAGVYGSARCQYAAKETGVRAIVGAELPLEDGSVLPVLAKSRLGYQNLCRLLTRAHLGVTAAAAENARPPEKPAIGSGTPARRRAKAPEDAPPAKGEGRVSFDQLAQFSAGLLALTGDSEGAVRQCLRRRDFDGAGVAMDRLVHLFGPENVVAEVQRHRLRYEDRFNRTIAGMAEQRGLRTVATGGACYAEKVDRTVLDAFSCLRHRTTLDRAGLLLAENSERYLRSAEDMAQLWHDWPGPAEASSRIAEELEFSLEDLGYEFPRFPVPAGDGEMADYLRKVTDEGALIRFGRDGMTSKVRKQLDHELALINRLGFAGYFLIVWDLMLWAKQQGIFCQGRGSAANSAVCYALSITNVDPIKQNLLFERFLSEGRKSWPDIDIDLPSGGQREKVIQEVYRRFAPFGAAMTANVITYRGRSAIREMAKVLGIPEDFSDRFSDLHGHGDFPHTLELLEHFEKAGLKRSHPRHEALAALYQGVLGLPRHLGQHSGGMVICDSGLDSVVPLEPASMPGRTVVQWDKDDCEDMGIIKVDLLGLGMLAAVEETLNFCAERGQPVDVSRIPKDDPETYDMLCRADTIGVFQVESRAQQATLPRMKPREFYDLVIEVALIRPGPIVGKLVHPYLDRRNKKQPVDYITEEFRPVLERTLGVPLFQEQVLKMAMVIADFSGSEAEELRRALSFHRSEERMNKVMAKLKAAKTRRGVAEDVQLRTIKGIRSFALYGFPESHAISFALIAYASAWLKAHRPAEFLAGLLNHQPMGFYSTATLVKDSRRHGVKVRPVCVCRSEVRCTIEADGGVRLGLNQVRGLSKAGAERIVASRKRGLWPTLDAFHHGTQLAVDERRVLARIGALNEIAGTRRQALWAVEAVEELPLFSRAAAGLPDNGPPSGPPPAPELPAMNEIERLEADYAGTGLTVGPHPMRLVRDRLRGVLTARELAAQRHGRRVSIAGLVVCRQRPGTAKGHVFISLEDETGIGNAFVESAVFEENRLIITQEPFLRLSGRVQRSPDGVISLFTETVEPMGYVALLENQSHDFH